MWSQQYINSHHEVSWPPENSALIKSGQVRSVLDAGSGTCSLDVLLRKKGLMHLLHPFIQFGAWECSMGRICGERGASQLDWDFLKPMPFCDSCTFDLVHQARAFHEFKTDAGPLRLALDNFDKVLSCGGRISIEDLILHPPSQNWTEVALDWTHKMGYEFQWLVKKPETAHIWIIKRC